VRLFRAQVRRLPIATLATCTEFKHADYDQAWTPRPRDYPDKAHTLREPSTRADPRRSEWGRFAATPETFEEASRWFDNCEISDLCKLSRSALGNESAALLTVSL